VYPAGLLNKVINPVLMALRDVRVKYYRADEIVIMHPIFKPNRLSRHVYMFQLSLRI